VTVSFALLLLAAGVLAGIVNAIAGGGILFVLPIMLAGGVGPVSAAASSAVAVVPAHAIAIFADRAGHEGVRDRLVRSAIIAAAGGIVGALLLLTTGDRLFRSLVPWLILFATLAFACGPRLAGVLRRQGGPGHPAAAGACEFLVAVYGGYFGAGLGVLMMAALSLLGVGDVRATNWLKNVLATVISAVAVAIYIAGGTVAWRETLAALAGALAGGYIVARLARVVPAEWLKRGVVAVGAGLSVYYFLH
jgi:hypothetical protein